MSRSTRYALRIRARGLTGFVALPPGLSLRSAIQFAIVWRDTRDKATIEIVEHAEPDIPVYTVKVGELV